MIEGLQPYAKYKESGLPWLGRYPTHWVMKRGKSYMTCIDQRSKAGKEELLTVSSARGVVPRNSAKVTMFKAESYAGYKLCWPGDLVINSLWAWGGGLGVAQHHGIISTAYSVYRCRPSAHINPRFLHELVRSRPFNWELQVRSKGIWISRLQLTDVSFLDAPIPLPPPDEQAAIVRFLDHANRKIDGFIRAKRKLIALLGEQKQAIIHRAVTRGLDPNAPLKPSGIPWLGDIPRHWEVWPLKRIGLFKSGAGFPVTAQGRKDLEVPFLKVSDMTLPGNDVWIQTSNNTVSRDDAQKLGAYIFPEGSIIFPKVGGAMLTNKRRLLKFPSCIDNNVMGCVVRQGHREFIFLLLQQLDFGRLSKPGPLPAIGEGEVREIKVVFPPIEEQRAIVTAVERECTPLNTAIARTEREIALMQEYRTRLTADVVTGKLDVRPAAAKLPAAEAEPEPAVPTDEDSTEEAELEAAETE
jgi:type I restriction enzyme S subunit